LKAALCPQETVDAEKADAEDEREAGEKIQKGHENQKADQS
jgi:hypothetical protein